MSGGRHDVVVAEPVTNELVPNHAGSLNMRADRALVRRLAEEAIAIVTSEAAQPRGGMRGAGLDGSGLRGPVLYWSGGRSMTAPPGLS